MTVKMGRTLSTVGRGTVILLVTLLAGCYGRFEPYREVNISVGSQGVEVPVCEPYDISSVRPAMKDCFSESARWQMMVNPEKSLPVKPAKIYSRGRGNTAAAAR